MKGKTMILMAVALGFGVVAAWFTYQLSLNRGQQLGAGLGIRVLPLGQPRIERRFQGRVFGKDGNRCARVLLTARFDTREHLLRGGQIVGDRLANLIANTQAQHREHGAQHQGNGQERHHQRAAHEPGRAHGPGSRTGSVKFICDAAPVTARVLAVAPRLRVISEYGAGYDNIDVEAAAARGVWVANVPDYCTAEVADHTLALLLALSRRLFPLDRRVEPQPARAVAMGQHEAMVEARVAGERQQIGIARRSADHQQRVRLGTTEHASEHARLYRHRRGAMARCGG